MAFLLFLSNIFFAFFQYSNKTPHMSGTPYPDTVLGDTPSFMYSWWFLGICGVFIALGVYGVYKHLNKVPGAGYINVGAPVVVAPQEPVEPTAPVEDTENKI